jgi:hypothetical protein
MDKVANRIGFQMETGADVGETRAMGEGMQAVPTELKFSDMAAISGAAAIGAGISEGMIRGIEYLFGDKYDPDSQQVKIKAIGPDGKTIGEFHLGLGKIKSVVDGYDEAKDKKQADEAKAKRKEEEKALKAKEKDEKPAEAKADDRKPEGDKDPEPEKH